MRTPRKFFFLAIGTSCLFLASCDPGDHTGKTEKPRKVVLPAGEIHEGWYFAAGEQVMIQGTINGDLYAGAGTVEINGVVNGDVIAAGGDVSVGGTVSDDIRVAGGTVRIDGTVGKSVTAAGGNVRVGPSGVIGGSLLAAGGNVQVSGKIGHDARIGAGNVDITGTVTGTVDVASDAVTVLPGSTISRNLNVYISDKDKAEIAEGTVKGVVKIVLEDDKTAETVLGIGKWLIWWKFFWVGSLLATLLGLVFLLRTPLLDVGTTIASRTGFSILWGIVGLIGIPVAVVLIFITVIGIPLGMLALAIYLWFLYLSQLSLAVLLGQRAFKVDRKQGWALFGWLALALVVVQIVTMIPYLGALIVLIGMVLGLGAILLVLQASIGRRRMPAKGI